MAARPPGLALGLSQPIATRKPHVLRRPRRPWAPGSAVRPQFAGKRRPNRPSLPGGKCRRWCTKGVSSPSIIQRQSPTEDRATQVGTPRLPARWATAVSGVTTRSSRLITAAVSRKSRSSSTFDCRGRAPRPGTARPGADLLGARSLLQADQANARYRRERGELVEREGSPAIDAVLRASLPGDPDLEDRSQVSDAKPRSSIGRQCAIVARRRRRDKAPAAGVWPGCCPGSPARS